MSKLNDYNCVVEHVDKSDELLISRFLTVVGISPARNGFRLLKEAIIIYSKGILKMSKVNEIIGIRNGITALAVERNIRGALNVAMDRNCLSRMNDIFSTHLLDASDRMTAKEFIATSAMYLLSDIANKRKLHENMSKMTYSKISI